MKKNEYISGIAHGYDSDDHAMVLGEMVVMNQAYCSWCDSIICAIENCNNSIFPDSEYCIYFCDEHKCVFGYCCENPVIDGFRYCVRHKCSIAECINVISKQSKTCIFHS
jgi:hypothetical protein